MNDTLSAPTLTEKLQARLFRPEDHPFRCYEREIRARLLPEHVLMDAGCGRTAEVLALFGGQARRCIGVDLGEPAPEVAAGGIEFHRRDMTDTGLAPASVDIVISRAVIEHLPDPAGAFQEIARVLRPGACFVSLAPNLWDYVSLVSKLVPNRLHPWIVKATEGRPVADTFPAYYRANTRRAILRLARHSGLQVESFRYLGQYPAAFLFNPVLFLMASAYEKLISRFESLGFLRGWILAVLVKPGPPGDGRSAP